MLPDIACELLEPYYPIHLHCYTGSIKHANLWMGHFTHVFFGLTNLVCMKRREVGGAHQLAIDLPLKRLLLETDCPHFVPRNVASCISFAHPGNALNVAKRIAELRNVNLRTVLNQTSENCRFLYYNL